MGESPGDTAGQSARYFDLHLVPMQQSPKSRPIKGRIRNLFFVSSSSHQPVRLPPSRSLAPLSFHHRTEAASPRRVFLDTTPPRLAATLMACKLGRALHEV